MSKLLLFALFMSMAKDLESNVNELVRLIERETERAETYLLPNDSEEYRPKSRKQTYLGTFDHIIIGAGAAGAIVATRLSEDCNKSILLLEAGDYETDFTDIPAMNSVSMNLQYNWNYKTMAQNNSCQIFTNGECDYRAGRGLGGSTIINGLLYARGCKWDYDNWALLGNDLWGYDRVLPFFKKLENYQISGDDGYHGHSGPVNVGYSQPLNPRTTTFLNANHELGKEIGDYNGENPFRAGRIQFNIIRGQRCSTGRAYLRRVWKYRNLHVLTRSYVTKILVNVQTKRAYGVVFAKDNQYFKAKSRNEIVLSAGTFRSPQILMLSGIGPKDHLTSLGIPVITDLPVGKVFKDRSRYSGLHIYINHSNSEEELDDQVRDYLHGKGLLTKGGTFWGVVFLKSNLSSLPRRPDIEVMMYNFPQIYSTLFNITDIENAVSLAPILLHPKSSGSITLNSSDPFEYPIINPNFFSDPNGEDMETLLEGIRYVLELINTESFKKINATLMMVHLPECKDYRYLSNEYFRCHSKYFVDVVLHAVATCKMGPSPSMGAVVDQKLRVHGIPNLMVADASVMPDTMSGHTSAPAMMIGERAAYLIRFGGSNN